MKSGLYMYLIVYFASLTVTNSQHTAPRFTLEPKDVTVAEGKPATLQCRATGKPDPTYSWRHNGIDMVLTTNGNERLLSNGDLYIGKVGKSHYGKYQCVVKVIYSAVSLTVLSRTARLQQSVTPLTFNAQPLPVTGYVGGAVRLSVDTSNFVPAPQIAWLYRGSARILASDPKYTVLPQGVIQISNIDSTNAGDLQAIAQNPVDGSQLRSNFVAVKVLPANQRPASKSASSSINIIGKPKDMNLRWGRSIILECLADAPGAVTYSWLKNNSPLAMTGRYSLFGPGNLQITTVKEEDEATYTCKAQGGSATAQASARVTIQVRPAFTIIPRSPTYGRVDGDVTFNYKVIGKPKPSISWMRDGVALAADQSYLIQGDGFLKATGLIKNDAGMYQVFARNEAGEAQASVELVIQDFDKPTPTSQITTTKPRSSLIPGKPKNVNAYPKSSSEMFVSWQPPDITNGEIKGYNVIYFATSTFESGKVSLDGKSTYVTVTNLDPNTDYTFRVQAVNGYGNGPLSTAVSSKTSSSGSVPGVISKLTPGSLTSSSVSFSWATPSGAAVTKYVVYYNDFQNSPSKIFQKETTTNSINIDGLKPSTNYKFWVIPFNGDVKGPQSTVFQWKTLPGSSTATAIQNFKVSPVSSTMSTVSWTIASGTTPPDSYEIYYADLDRSPNTPSKATLSATTSAFLKDLRPSTSYKIWIVPYLNGVRGVKSNDIILKTPVSVPSTSPRNVQITSTTTDSVTVKWAPLTRDESNGQLIWYTLRYKIAGSKAKAVTKTVLPTATTAVITGLKSDTEYSVRIAGATTAGDGPFSPSVKGKTLKVAGPSKPIAFNVKLDHSNPKVLNLVWKQPDSYINSITQYEILYNNGGQWEKYQIGGTTNSMTINNAKTGTNYNFKIRARDVNNWGEFTDVFSIRTMDDSSSPGPVHNLAANPTVEGLTITWLPPMNYASVFVSGYEVHIRDLTNVTNVFDVVKLNGWKSTTFKATKGIVPGHVYDVVVKAVNAKNMKSTATTTKTKIDKVVPFLAIDHVKLGSRSITFNWTDSKAVTGAKYLIKYTQYDEEGRSKIIRLTAFDKKITIKGLTPYTQYAFDISRDGAILGTGVTLQKKTLSAVPSAPVDVTAKSNNTWVYLSWQVPIYPNGEIKTYKILYTTDNNQKDADRISRDIGGTGMAYNVTGLTSQTSYYFKVVAENDAGVGAASEAVGIATSGGAGGVAVPGGKIVPAGTGGAHHADDLDSKLWWIILVIILLLLLLILLLLLLYCCCCRKKGQDCCPCCFACFDKYCLPCLICCCPCCCKDKKSHDKNTYVAAPGAANGFKKDETWRRGGGAAAAARVDETELRPLAANEFEAAVPPPVPIVPGSAKLNAENYSKSAASNGSLNSSRSGGGIRVAVPGDATFISYKTSLNDYCQKSGWLQPHYNCNHDQGGFVSNVVCGGSQYGGGSGAEISASKQEAEQRAAFAALQGIGMVPSSAKFGIDASIAIPSPGEQSFISYKCSLHDFCQQCNILPPRFTTAVKSQGHTSQVSVGSYNFNTDSASHSCQDAEQKVAYIALHGLCMMESTAQYNPAACFTVAGPGDASFISFKSSLHDFCQRYKLPPPQYITTQMAQGYSAKLKFGGLFFQSSDYFTTRLEAEQHAAFEALQGLGLLESGVRFGSGDTERASSRAGSQLSLASSGVGEGRTIGSRVGNHSRHGSSSQLSYTSSARDNTESSALYRSEATTQAHSEFSSGGGYGGAATGSGGYGGAAIGSGGGGYGGAATSSGGGGYGGAATVSSGGGYGGAATGSGGGGKAGSNDARAVFISKTTIPRVERSNSHGGSERTYEKSVESRFGNGGMSYSVTYQHSTVRNVSTLPRKPPSYTTSSTYTQFASGGDRLSNNRRAYSSSNAVNDDPNSREFSEMKSASHPALSELEREMAGLEGLIKDLNGITSSQQGIKT